PRAGRRREPGARSAGPAGTTGGTAAAASSVGAGGGLGPPRDRVSAAPRSALHPVEFAAQRHEVWQIGSILPEAASLPQQSKSIRARTAGEIPVDRLADELALAAPGTIGQGRQLLAFTLGEIDLRPDHAYPMVYMGNV